MLRPSDSGKTPSIEPRRVLLPSNSGRTLSIGPSRELLVEAKALGQILPSPTRPASDAATDMRFRPEIALTRLQLAELLPENCPDERPEALEHLDFVIGEFREMKMQPPLERALRHKKTLRA